MSGTASGGQKAKITNIEKYGKDYYRNLGRLGGRAGNTGGFAANPELAKRAGRLGGLKSKRGKDHYLALSKDGKRVFVGNIKECAEFVECNQNTLSRKIRNGENIFEYEWTKITKIEYLETRKDYRDVY